MIKRKILYCISKDENDPLTAYVTIVDEKFWKSHGHISDSFPTWMEKLEDKYFTPNGIISCMESVWEVMLDWQGTGKFKDIQELREYLDSIPGMIYSKELENFINNE